ncbi:MAG: hypothetical protein ACLPZM_05870 [Thermoplasmata archaeon]
MVGSTPSPPTTPPRRRYPTAMALPLVVAAVTMMLEGVYFVAYYAGTPSSAFIPSGSLVPSLYVSGFLVFLEGAFILGLALLVLTGPSWNRLVGIGAISLGLLSLFSGGGFLVGAVLAWFGGIFAIYYIPSPTPATPARPEAEVLDDDPVIEADMMGSETRFTDLR